MAQTAGKHHYSAQKGASSGRSSLKATVKDQSGAGKVRIGDILCKEGHITSGQLQEALNYQKKNKGRLGNILLQLGYIEEETIVNVLSRIHNFPATIISKMTPDPEAIKILPYDKAKEHLAFPLRLKGDVLEVTMAEPTDTTAVETMQAETKKSIKVRVSSEKDIIEAYKKYYKISDEEYDSFFGKKEIEEEEEDMPVTQVDDFGSLVSEAAGDLELESLDEDDEDEFSAGDAPIIKLVNGILIRAVNDGVSDIHIEPFEKALQVRYRVDGSLYKSMNLPITIKNAMISRIKIIATLDISERRVPQDGRIKLRLGKRRVIDFRVSTLPTLFGEGIVLRILDPAALNVDLTKLGFEPKTYEAFKRCIARPYGFLLVASR